MPYGEPDIIDAHAQLTERVRKLEIMNVSRTLIPKRWKPHNPAADMAYCHMIRAAGLDPQTPGLGPLPQRIPPEVDAVFFDNEWPPIDDLWTFWIRTGYGPRYWLGDLVKTGGFYEFFTESPYRRYWTAYGPDQADVYFDEANPPGSAPGVYMDTYSGLTVFGGSDVAMPDGGYFQGAKVVGDHRLYATGGMPAPLPCQVPGRVDIVQILGEPHAYTIPVGNAGCPENPIHPIGSSGELDARYYTEDIKMMQPLRPPWAVDLFGDPGAALGTPTVPILFPVSPSVLRARIPIGLAVYPALEAWYDAMAVRSRARLTQPDHAHWQTLPLFPPWWGRLECRYDARFVYFRGRVRNAADNRPEIAAFPNWLPIGPRIGSYMPASTTGGQPIQINLSHNFRTENLDDYKRGEGSHLRVSQPNMADITESGSPLGVEIVMDGCKFGIYEGPFDGSNPAYADLRP